MWLVKNLLHWMAVWTNMENIRLSDGIGKWMQDSSLLVIAVANILVELFPHINIHM